MNKISKLIILACACQSLQAGEVFWANGVDQSSGWSVYLQYPNQCWGAVAGNTLGWWQANLQASLNLKEGAPQGNKEITDWFYEKYPHIQGGLQPYRGMIYYLQDFSPGFKLYEDNNNPTYLERTYGPTKISGAPFWTERYDSAANGIVKSLVDNFKTGKVVAALTDDTHTVVLWGIEVDADGRIKKGYVSDSVVDKNGDLTLREVVGNYVPDYKTGEMNFRFLYSYYVSKTNTYITDAYEIYSITYLSIDEARNNGTYVDTSNRQDCLLSVLPGDEWACAIQTNNPQEGGSENTGSSSGSESAGSGQSPDNGTTNNPSSGGSSQTPPSGGSSSGSSGGGESLENNQGGGSSSENTGGSSGINPGNNPQQGGSGNAGSSGGGNTGSQTPPSGDVANHETTQAVQEAASKHSELSIAVEEIGNVTFYRIQKNGKDIALYNPHFSKPLITNKGLVDYDIQTHADGGIEITKTINQAAVQEANDVSALNMDINYVDINNLNKRMGELRGIDANAGAWARILGGKGSSSGFENTFTHIQAGFDKQSEIAGGGQIFSGITLTHTNSKLEGNTNNGNVKSVGGGVYVSGVFDNGFYVDGIAKYVANHHKIDYSFEAMRLSFLNSNYNTNSIYLGGEFGYRFYFGSVYLEPQAEFVYLNNSGATLNANGYNLEIKSSDLLVGRAGFNLAKAIKLGSIETYALGGLSYQWELLKSGEIVVDGESAKYDKKDSRMLMNLGLNMRASNDLSLGLTLEKSVFGDYDTDLAVNANIRYSF